MKTFLAAFIGVLTAIGLTLMVLAVGLTLLAPTKEKIRDHSWLLIDLHGGLLEYDPPVDVLTALTSGDVETLQRILDNLSKARFDDRIEGVVLRMSFGASMGAAKAEEIRGAIHRLREADKKVYAYAESFQEGEYYILAACDEIFAPPSALIGFKGFAFTTMHMRGTMDKLGITPNIHKIEAYKSAPEQFTRKDLSEPARENLEWLMDEYWSRFTTALSEDRSFTEEQVVALMEQAIFDGRSALEAGLIDRTMYWEDVRQMLENDGDLHTVGQSRYAEVSPRSLGLRGRKRVAVIHAQGTIAGRTNEINPMLGLMIGHETINAEFRRAREDDKVAAVVFRVDSPGGSGPDSDLMAEEVERTAAVKPVVVSMVDVAASGGYWIAYRGSKVVANPTTITGSIGSINGKFNISGLYEKLGITHDGITRGPMALLFSELQDWTPKERARLEKQHWDYFNAWLRDIAEHRGMTFEEAEQLAHGRVWTGRQAFDNGLIDEVGGLERAIELAKELAEIPADQNVRVEHYPKKKELVEVLLSGDAPLATAARFTAYRFLREDIVGTLELVSQNPSLVTAAWGSFGPVPIAP